MENESYPLMNRMLLWTSMAFQQAFLCMSKIAGQFRLLGTLLIEDLLNFVDSSLVVFFLNTED